MTDFAYEPVDAAGIVLRPFRDADIDDIVATFDDGQSHRFLLGLPRPYTRADAIDWLHRAAPALWSEGAPQYAIADPGSGRYLGSVGLTRPRRDGHEISVGYAVAPWARGRGVATAALRTATDLAFRHGFGRVELTTDQANEPSQRVALAAGFGHEGIRRGTGPNPDGPWRDVVVWTRLATDSGEPTRRILPDLPHPEPAERGPSAGGPAVGGPAAGGPAVGGPAERGPADGELTDGVVTLRRIRPTDTEAVYALSQLPEVIATTVSDAPPTRERAADRCARAGYYWLTGTRADLAICDAATGDFAGHIGLFTEPPTSQAMIGYDVAPEWRRRGFASRATRILADWAFDHAGFARIVAGAAPENVASQRTLERAGLRREGYERSRLPGAGGGARVDNVLFAILPSDREQV